MAGRGTEAIPNELTRFLRLAWRLRIWIGCWIVVVGGVTVGYERLTPLRYRAELMGRGGRISTIGMLEEGRGATLPAITSFAGGQIGGTTWSIEEGDVLKFWFEGQVASAVEREQPRNRVEFIWVPKLDPQGVLKTSDTIFRLRVEGPEREALVGILERSYHEIEGHQTRIFGKVEADVATYRKKMNDLHAESLATIDRLGEAQRERAGADENRQFLVELEGSRAKTEAWLERLKNEFALLYHPPEILASAQALADPVWPKASLIYPLAGAVSLVGAALLTAIVAASRGLPGGGGSPAIG